MGETIHAVIWLCDLRRFTELSETLARDDLIALLNDYFGAMVGAVEDEGGEVLKFIGDAMLAIFRSMPALPLRWRAPGPCPPPTKRAPQRP